MSNSMLTWKPNWDETRGHFEAWWRHEGLVLTTGWQPAEPPHERVPEPPPAPTVEASYADGAMRAWRQHHVLSRHRYQADTLPIADTMIGPGSLALFLGSEPGFSPETVWFEPCMMNVAEPESLPPLRFNPESRWWTITEETCRACAERARGKYLVGCPDLVENVDIIAALRDPQTLMMDMIERPEWVEQKVAEINQAFFEAYQRIYDIVKLPDGSSSFVAFGLWGPGKTAKVQCDASAMFSPAMFRRFVVPALTAQCEWLDQSMFHLDGTQCLCHLDILLEIEPLDAVEWTPQAGIEGGGHRRWYDVYRRILAAGKSVQAIGVKADEVEPLLDAVGPRGMYIMTWPQSGREVESILNVLQRYR
jgi:hypothetical protein